MDLIERARFYSNLSIVVPLFLLDSRRTDKSIEEKRESLLREVAESFNNKLGCYSELEKMASNYYPEFYRRWKPIIEKYLIDPQFSEIIVEGGKHLVQNENEVVAFVSSHRSLYDVPIHGIIFFDSKVKLPVYSAGRNLAKFIFKWGLQKFGAALIDREKLINKDRFTTLLTSHYFEQLNLQGVNTLSYLEGTRSRTTAFQEINSVFFKPPISGQKRRMDLDYKVIPITVSYDRVPEDMELIRVKKSSGRKKSLSERLVELGKAHSWIGHNFGRVYVTFSEPIYLKELVEAELSDIQVRKILKEKVEKEFRRKYKVTPFMLMAYAALNPATSLLKTYERTAESLKYQGFNIEIECPKDSFFETLGHPFTRRFLKCTKEPVCINEELMRYYAAHLVDIL